MTEDEKQLFTALKDRSKGMPERIKLLVERELEHRKNNAHKINPDIQDEKGKGFAHYAAEACYGDVIDAIVVDLRCSTKIKDNDDKLPQDYKDNARFAKAIKKRDELIKKEAYDTRVKNTKLKENETKAYQKGIVFTYNFDLYYPISDQLQCDLPQPQDEKSGYTIHETLAIMNAFLINNKAKTLKDFRLEYTSRIKLKPQKTNYFFGNIGCVISEEKCENPGSYKSKFITAPIYVEQAHNFLSPDETRIERHSDQVFVHVLKKEEFLLEIIKNLLKTNNISTLPRQVYSIIFDLHSSQEVCEMQCEQEFFNFQTQNIEYVKNALKKLNLVAPVDPGFKIMFRISATNIATHSAYRGSPENRTEEKELSRTYTHTSPMDLKASEIPLILHGDEKLGDNLKKFYDKEFYKGKPALSLQKYSIFENTNKNSLTGLFNFSVEEPVVYEPTPADALATAVVSTSTSIKASAAGTTQSSPSKAMMSMFGVPNSTVPVPATASSQPAATTTPTKPPSAPSPSPGGSSTH